MSDTKKDAERKSILQRIENFLSGTKNKIVFTADNSELDFYELDSEATPAIGDKAKFDGKPAGESNDGKHVMPNGETYVFTGEELTEITPKADEATDDLEAENTSLREEVQNLKARISNLTTEKEGISNKLKDAEQILKNFKELESGAGEVENPAKARNSKQEPTKRNLFKNIK